MRSKPACLLLVVLASMAAGCATTGGAKPLVPSAFETRTGPYTVYTGTKLDADAPVVRQLQQLETQVGETLGVRVSPGESPVEVYILEDRKAFEHFLLFYYPDLPPRRAFFLAQGNKRLIYTFFGDRLEEDIRHEATHALLHVAIGDIPLWLDEGLAEYFESPNRPEGTNAEHLGRLPADLASGWKPDLARLETMKAVRQMSPRDYRESWGWVHYLLNDSKANKANLIAYLSELRTNPAPTPLSNRLEAEAAAPMLVHLKQVQTQPVVATSPRDSTVRLQSGQTEPATVPPAKKKGLLSRLFGS